MTTDSDGDLVARAARGDIYAFEQLFARYKTQVYRVALGVTRDASAAEEIMLDTFYRLNDNLGTIDQNRPIFPWLYRVAVNLSCNRMEKKHLIQESIENVAHLLFADHVSSPSAQAEANELARIMHEALCALAPRQRAAIVLHYYRGLKIDEIAEILQCEPGTVKSTLSAARNILRHRLKEDQRVALEVIHESF